MANPQKWLFASFLGIDSGSRSNRNLWWDWLTADVVSMFALNERQLRVLPLLKAQRKITIGGYMNFVNCLRRTAGHDLDEFIAKGILRRVGRGRGTHYELVKKYAKNVPNVPPEY